MNLLVAFFIGLISGILLLLLALLLFADCAAKKMGYQNIFEYFDDIDT